MKILVIPDIHQRVNSVDRILQRESDFDKVIFLGDFFDSYDPEVGARETAKWVMNKWKELGDKAVWLVGNHDAAYYEYKIKYVNSNFHNVRELVFWCTGVTKNKAVEISKEISIDFIRNCKLAHFEEGILFSHAGILPHLIPVTESDEDSLRDFLKICHHQWETFPYVDITNSIFGVGYCRGGRQSVGGLLWCDWNDEFFDGLPWSQIVGHTLGVSPRKMGKCYNIDTGSQHYAVVENGKVTIKENGKS